MFEARLTQGKVFKQLIEALKDLVQEANIDCTDDEMSIQAMDNSHVALVAVCLRSGGFDHFRCDRPISLGFNATNMGKILKCAGNDDIITLKAEDDGDSLALVFESPSQDRIADFGECFFFIVRFFSGGRVGAGKGNVYIMHEAFLRRSSRTCSFAFFRHWHCWCM